MVFAGGLTGGVEVGIGPLDDRLRGVGILDVSQSHAQVDGAQALMVGPGAVDAELPEFLDDRGGLLIRGFWQRDDEFIAA